MKKLLLFVLMGLASGVVAQQPGAPAIRPDAPPPFFPGDGPPPDGGRGMGGPPQEETKLVEKFDKNADGRLNAEERKAAREFVQKERAEGRGRRGPGGRGPRAEENQEPPRPGAKVSPADVKSFPGAPLYDPAVVRTLFLDFESADWEKELADFNNSDVEVPATLTVDGKVYKEVGVHFRGASSFFTVAEGRKRSLNVAVDFANRKQEIGGYRTLNLLNAHVDPSFLRTVLYYQIAREYIPAPKANFVRVVINGEDWGVYVNAQQFNKDFLQDAFGTTKGERWKVPGSPRGQGSLAYLGNDPEKYKRIYQIKSKDDPKSWQALIQLCKVLNETPSDKLEAALAPILDINGTLKFLALENALINNDGYWVRTSDYNLYRDEQGRFRLIPADANETFARAGGPGFGRRGGFRGPDVDGTNRPPSVPEAPAAPAAGLKLDPLVAANDTNKVLIAKLLSVPSLHQRYLGYVRDIADKWLDWKKLGPLAEKHHALIAADVKRDTRKLSSYEAFEQSLTGSTAAEPTAGERGPGRAPLSLKAFADERRAFLLEKTK